MTFDSEQKPGIYIHIGKPKCASTFLQKEVFTLSKYKFIGKPYNYNVKENRNPSIDGFNYGKLKSIISYGLNNKDMVASLKLSKFARKHEILLSEENLTARILCMFRMILISEFGEEDGRLEIDSFKRGLILGITVGSSSKLQAEYDSGSIIYRIVDSFNRDLRNIMLIDRDYGEWITSLFLQFFSQNNNRENSKEREVFIHPRLFNRNSLFGLAGFGIGIEKSASRHNKSFGIEKRSIENSIRNHFPNANLITLDYSKDENIFKDQLVKSAKFFGVNEKFLCKTDFSQKVNDSNRKGRPSFSVEDCPEKINFLLRSLVSNIT